MGGDIPELWKQRVSEEAVANVLALISAPPNRREKPLAGDLERRFDFWFDGGACAIITGWNEYVFREGTVAQVGSCNPTLSVSVRFPDGRRVTVEQKSA